MYSYHMHFQTDEKNKPMKIEEQSAKSVTCHNKSQDPDQFSVLLKLEVSQDFQNGYGKSPDGRLTRTLYYPKSTASYQMTGFRMRL